MDQPSSSVPRLPQPSAFNVDYFSHEWDEMDLKTSWSLMTKQKRTRLDGIRLENASWRKWIQKRLGLRRVAPEKLRWKKDEDITWLYGPMVRNKYSTDAEWYEDSARVVAQASASRRRSITNQPVVFGTTATHSDTLGLEDVCETLGAAGTSTGTQTHAGDRSNTATATSAPFQTTPIPVTMIPNSKKPALKKSQDSQIQDFRRFQLDIERRLLHKFPHLSTLSSSISDAPFHLELEPSALNTVRRTGTLAYTRSDTMLYAPNAKMYLEKQEVDLLRQMNSGPAIAPLSPDNSPTSPTTVPNINALLGDASHEKKRTKPHQQQPRRGKLRFSAEVEVMEYDASERALVTSASSSRLRNQSSLMTPGFAAVVSSSSTAAPSYASVVGAGGSSTANYHNQPQATATTIVASSNKSTSLSDSSSSSFSTPHTSPQRNTMEHAHEDEDAEDGGLSTVGSLAKVVWDVASWAVSSLISSNKNAETHTVSNNNESAGSPSSLSDDASDSR